MTRLRSVLGRVPRPALVRVRGRSMSPTYRAAYHDDPYTGIGDKDYQVIKDNASGVWKNGITVFLDDPCALYPKDQKKNCAVTLRNQKYGPTAWDAYDAKGGKL